MAFVVIQHLDPTRKNHMSELIQRSTLMPVVQIKDHTRIAPDHVYIIPPNKDLSILRGMLHLLEPTTSHGLGLPIDFFFRALADDYQEKSIGVILSGMGSDGTEGARAIKAKSGTVFAQSPESAKFESMPRMVTAAQLADVIATPEELPGKIIGYLRQSPPHTNHQGDLSPHELLDLEKITLLLRAQTGHDFTRYKKNTLGRRVERRMAIHQITKSSVYQRYLRANPQEGELLFKELLIGVTRFFRDPEVWNQLRDKVLPDLLARHPEGRDFRAWSAGCSTGEEAYSLAILFQEAVEKLKSKRKYTLQIFATDLDDQAIQHARIGRFPSSVVAELSERQLSRFFIADEQGGFTVRSTIREMVVFAPQNIVMHPPFTKLDLALCRNLLIYFESDLQQKIIPLLHYSLNPEGILILGAAETIGSATDLFKPLMASARIYQRLENMRRRPSYTFPISYNEPLMKEPNKKSPDPAESSSLNLQALADQFLLQGYTPASVLVNQDGDILYVSGKTGKFLEPARGKANWNLFAMCHEGITGVVTETFHAAVAQKAAVSAYHVRVDSDAGPFTFDLTVEPLPDAGRDSVLLMVLFHNSQPAPDAPSGKKKKSDSAKKPAVNDQLDAIQRELKAAKLELQSTRIQMQTSREELKSTNEELQSTNEELQSTNEELTTSKEEMQSMNEELQTVNQELQIKVDELSHTSNDMNNLLNSTDIAIIFLDDRLHIRRFTPQAVDIFKLIPSDTGRPITDIVSTLDYPDLKKDTQTVLDTLNRVEKQVAAKGDRWFNICIIPYRTQENKIDGVVITFSDITKTKTLEFSLRKTQEQNPPPE